MLSEKKQLEAFMNQLRKGEKDKLKKPLKLHVLDDDGNLKEIDSTMVFIQTGDDVGFIAYKGFDKENACMFYSYPGFSIESNKGSSFALRTRCGNTLDFSVEPRDNDFSEETKKKVREAMKKKNNKKDSPK